MPPFRYFVPGPPFTAHSPGPIAIVVFALLFVGAVALGLAVLSWAPWSRGHSRRPNRVT